MQQKRAILDQLRSTLGERFPMARHQVDHTPAPPTKTAELNAQQLPASCLIECSTAAQKATSPVPSGHGLAIAALLATHTQVPAPLPHTVLVDAADHFNPASYPPAQLERTLWLRCHSATEAINACDIVLRDPNLPLVIADFSLTQPAELRKIPITLWYRLRRLIDDSGCSVVALTPQPLIPAATQRLTISPPHGIDHDLHHRSELLTTPWLESQAATTQPALRA
ncbi:hypothetical protein [Sulfuriroseicoccus oceanibius]|uniref:DNA recombination and repair protein Rad51-like C-terminal domain-containing protein n=1 Tax=Sulfuriroseicoccus oceanibius TaxID=2707525 RepID=A0A6B3L4S8_9BACT|nr:hypothetical protein [Sulfuriroseicoccus oceanibius]QQL43984.1 hypothetical protein G3M56_008760 [Sulfuriroseicoccus oceanibius]